MRIALGIEYCGADFYGWQAQAHLPTVQGALEQALSQIAAEPIKTFCAGRTDAGVHATSQVVHFDTEANRVPYAWIAGTNSHLPPTIAVRWMQDVPGNFHARYSATARAYRYIIYNHRVRPALLAKRVAWYYYPLDAEAMHEAGQYLLGEHDFSSFRAAECESPTAMRCIHSLTVKRQGDLIVIDIQANAFLQHMVRNIVGVLLKIGAGQRQPQWMVEVLHAKDRRQAASTAAPSGLYLTYVAYPAEFNLPVVAALPYEYLSA